MIKTQQILLFSATFPDEVYGFAQEFSANANEIKLKRDELTVSGIKQMFMDCPDETGKYEILVKLYGLMTIGSSIIFVKVIHDAQTFPLAMLINTTAKGHCHSYCPTPDSRRSQGCRDSRSFRGFRERHSS